MDEANDGQVLFGGLQILPQGKNVGALRDKIAHRGENLLALLAQAEHQARLCRHLRRKLFRAPQQFERPLVHRASAHLAIEPRHGLGVVVKHVGLGGDHGFQRRPNTAEVRDQHFDLAARHSLPDLGDRARENGRATVRLIVAVH